jgi:DNA modification methylase
MELITIPISKLQSNTGQLEALGVPKNPRLIKDARYKALLKSIQDHPQFLEAREVVVYPHGKKYVVLGGNMRLQACKELGYKELPCKVFPESATPEEIRAFIIKDNVGFGEWSEDLGNWDALELQDWGLELPDFGEVVEAEIEEHEAEEPSESMQVDVVLGDLIEIGRHRLVCGDSTTVEAVDKVLGGAKPFLMITDPPYGVEYDAEWRNEAGLNNGGAFGKVLNDNRADWTEAWALSPASVAYVWHAQWFTDIVKQSLQNVGFDLRYLIIWAKQHFAIGRGHYHPKYEPCWMGVRKGATADWIGDRKQTTVWDIDKPTKSETGHSTQKPIECMAKPMRNHGGDVYDPFGGSGTTMVAAEQLNRTCYMIELNPLYCQVIINRMRKAFPELPIKINGSPY